MSYIAHLAIGLVGAGCAYVGRSFCPHRRHQIIVTGVLLVADAVASVQLIG